MSFRTRLTSFFVLIVVVPMLAVGFLVFRLITDSEQGKAQARANGLASAAVGVYRSASAAGSADARTIARALSSGAGSRASAVVHARISSLAAAAGLARVVVSVGQRTVAAVGDPTAVAPGLAVVGSQKMTIAASELTAAQYVGELSAPGAVMIVRQGGRVLASTLAPGTRAPASASGNAVDVGGNAYRAVAVTLPGFGPSPVGLTVLSRGSATGASPTGSKVFAGAIIVAFLLLALGFAVLASRGLQGQLSRFLQAAKRLAGGNFSSPIPIEGHDEFAALGQEFNNMSDQLAERLEELSQERARLREAIRRIGETFASNLDRPALLQLALKTAVDAVQGSAGRVTARTNSDDPLVEEASQGSMTRFRGIVRDAEREALSTGTLGEASDMHGSVLSVPLVPVEPGARTHGLITVVSRQGEFSGEDREMLSTLAVQASFALENVDLHTEVSRQAVTDELTGLANHGRFQEQLAFQLEQVRRYHYPLGLIMLDLDNFKSINDTYGHPQGDIVLRRVARVLVDNSREADCAARYGGEEMALILPHTDLEGAYAIAERIRSTIEHLRIPRRDRAGTLHITASLGVIAAADRGGSDLLAEADGALYEAKRQGKNRTVRGPVRAANVLGAE
jgi:diguanylate cyclase (GGDEF)-like protein